MVQEIEEKFPDEAQTALGNISTSDLLSNLQVET
jgi:hypothetical protein